MELTITNAVWGQIHQGFNNSNYFHKALATLAALVTAFVTPFFMFFDFLSNCCKTEKKNDQVSNDSAPGPANKTGLGAKNVSKVPSILDFYRDEKENDRGMNLELIWGASHHWLENDHYYIQWLFPTNRQSGPNATAPMTNSETIKAFKSSPELQEKMIKSFNVMLKFFGLKWENDQVEYASNFKRASQNWIYDHKHNFLRITRILTSLRLHGLGKYADAFYTRLFDINKNHGNAIGSSFQYWSTA